jgi:hypothetical protein
MERASHIPDSIATLETGRMAYQISGSGYELVAQTAQIAIPSIFSAATFFESDFKRSSVRNAG